MRERERQREREGKRREKEREKHRCERTGDRIRNLLVYGTCPKQLSHLARARIFLIGHWILTTYLGASGF